MASGAIVSNQPVHHYELHTMQATPQNGQRDAETGVVANAEDAPMRANALSFRECLGSGIARGVGGATAFLGLIGTVVFAYYVDSAKQSGKEPHPGSIAGLAISLVALVGGGIIGINRTPFYSNSFPNGECALKCF